MGNREDTGGGGGIVKTQVGGGRIVKTQVVVDCEDTGGGNSEDTGGGGGGIVKTQVAGE